MIFACYILLYTNAVHDIFQSIWYNLAIDTNQSGGFMSAKYIRLANILRESIFQNTGNGIYKLPSEKELCEQYHMSRQTVRAALRLLTEERLIEKRKGSGSFSTGLGSMQNTIAVIVNFAEEYTTPSFLASIKSVLAAKGYSIDVYPTCCRVSEERKILNHLKDASIRGLIVEGCKNALPNPNLDLYRQLMAKGIAILFAGDVYPGLENCVCIKDDNYYGGYLLAKHLVELGHTKIASIFQIDELRGLERYLGFASALRDFNLPLPEELIVWYTAATLESLESKSDTGFLTDLLRRNKGMFSAAICQNDEIAYWLIRELEYAELRVPEDMSVVSFDNSYMSDLNSVHITTLSHEKDIGAATASTLLQMIQGETVFSEELSWELIDKNSDAPYEK